MLGERHTAAQGDEMYSRRSVPLLVVIWLVVGGVVAGSHHYFDNLNSLGTILTALLAILVWPLVLLGVKISIGT